MRVSSKRGALRLETGLLLVGMMLLAGCTYLLATVDQRVRAVEKVKDKEYGEDYYRFAELMAEIFVDIEDKYVEDVPPEKLFKAALSGVFDALDPHSAYLSADNFKELEKNTIEGEFSGIGIHIGMRDEILTVISPIPGTPAARAGLKAWDRIVEIEGESTEGMNLQDAVKRLTGPVGTEVSVKVYRPSDGKAKTHKIVRDRVVIENVYANTDEGKHVTEYYKYLLDNKIGYVRLLKFVSDHTSSHLEAALEKMKKAGVEGLILDLRYNSGGLLTESIRTADFFLNKNDVVVVTKGRLSDQNQEYRARDGKLVDWPMIVLVNEGTASAAEILSGALQDHHRALLLGPEGRTTFGKGLVQTIVPLRVSLERDDKGNDLPNAIQVTTAKYYTPNNAGPDGKCIQGVGITPDITVKLTRKQESQVLRKGLLLGDPISEEPDTKSGDDKAVKKDEGGDKDDDQSDDDEGEPFYLRKKKKLPPTPKTEDVQLRYGVDVLRGMMLARSAEAK